MEAAVEGFAGDSVNWSCFRSPRGTGVKKPAGARGTDAAARSGHKPLKPIV
jgi:hypothetical protein